MSRRRSTGLRNRRFTALALALALTLLALLPAVAGASPAAQSSQSQIAMSVQAGYGDDSSYIIGEWFPVRVTLTNPAGAPSLRVRVEVDSIANSGTATTSYVREVDLPSPARKEVTLYAYNQNYGHTTDVRLVQGETVLKTVQTQMNPLDPSSDMMVGVISSDASTLNVLRSEKAGHVGAHFYSTYYGNRPVGVPGSNSGSRVSISHIALADLPPVPAALDTFSALVLEDPGTGALSAEQKSALGVWVSHGGTLIVSPRPGGADVTSGLADLLPVKVSGTRNVSAVDSLGAFVSSPITPLGNLLVPAATPVYDVPVAARVLAMNDGVPLLAERTLGRGQVYYLALSPALAPLRNWDGLVPLFKRLLAEHEVGPSPMSLQAQNAYNVYGYPQSGPFSVYGDILDLPGLDLPSGWLLALFLFVYIIIIGPVNFIVLRRMRRAELAWITIPVLVVLFSIGAYALAYGAKGGDIIMPRANVTYAVPGVEDSTNVGVFGLFSPLRRTYSLNLGADSLVSQLDRYGGQSGAEAPRVVGGGGTTTVESVIVDTGAMKGFSTQSIVKEPARLEGDLHLGSDAIEGTLRNRTTGGLQDVALIRGDAVQYIGYIAPGASVQVHLPLSSRPFSASSASILPPPSGLSLPTSGYYYGNSLSDEQRAYNRKVGLLNMALSPLLTNAPPTDLDVLALAWSGSSPFGVDVAGHVARTDEVSLWTSSLQVKGSQGNGAQVSGGVPFWTYVAGSEAAWLAGQVGQTLSPYADLNFTLPAGTQPQSLSLVYDLGAMNISDVDWLAYNVRTGQWDRLAGLMDVPVSPGAQTPKPVPTAGANGPYPFPVPTQALLPTPTLSQPYQVGQPGARVLAIDPASYAGPGGYVTLRLASRTGSTIVMFGGLALELNHQP